MHQTQLSIYPVIFVDHVLSSKVIAKKKANKALTALNKSIYAVDFCVVARLDSACTCVCVFHSVFTRLLAPRISIANKINRNGTRTK